MREIVFGCVLLLALMASGYSLHSFFKTYYAAEEEAGPRLRRAAMIVSLSTIALHTIMAAAGLILLYLYQIIGIELVVTFAAAYAVIAVIVVFAARKSRYSGQIGDIHERIIAELVIYSAFFVLTFVLFMFGVTAAK